jgi:hypothetical protein
MASLLSSPVNTWLVDTGFIIALAAPRDHYGNPPIFSIKRK